MVHFFLQSPRFFCSESLGAVFHLSVTGEGRVSVVSGQQIDIVRDEGSTILSRSSDGQPNPLDHYVTHDPAYLEPDAVPLESQDRGHHNSSYS